jgi:hypothetical protein
LCGPNNRSGKQSGTRATGASEFELLAETEPLPEARLRYRIIARHYRELADREEQSDRARMAEHLKMLKLKRREAAE